MPMTKKELLDLITNTVKAVTDPIAAKLTGLEAKATSRAAEIYENTPRVEVVEEPPKKGQRAAQCLRAFAKSMRSTRSGRYMDVVQSAKALYGEAHPVTKALSSSTFEEGGVLLPQQYADDFVEVSREKSVMRSMGIAELPLLGGKLSIPKMKNGAVVGWIGESEALALTEQGFGNVQDSGHKIGALIPMSNDWLNHTGGEYDSFVLQDAVRAIDEEVDTTLIRSDGTAGRPKGLRYWANTANVLAANGTVNYTNVGKDLGRLRLAIRRRKLDTTNCITLLGVSAEEFLDDLRDGNGNLIYSAQLEKGRLKKADYRATSLIPEDLVGNTSEIYHFDRAQMVIGIGRELKVDMSAEATYKTSTGEVISAFQNDQTLLRVIQELTMVCRNDYGISVLTGITWSPEL